MPFPLSSCHVGLCCSRTIRTTNQPFLLVIQGE
ncbi:hypothetical protein FHW67_004171 [Herbaspirillum sp. Sphag1AN]|nr:hypothetical protein [Herbaspirillum sp. Sphag1AN]MBB3248041.1 hypothetical protein [Herbaspirillum sp. Sphag64]